MTALSWSGESWKAHRQQDSLASTAREEITVSPVKEKVKTQNDPK